MAEPAATLLARIGLDTSAFTKGLKDLEGKLTGLGTKLAATGKKMSIGITAPLVAAGAASVKFATDFESSISKIENLVGISGEALEELRTGALSLSGHVGRTPLELADALFVVTSAGAAAGDALDIVEIAAKASAIGMGETQTVAKAVTAAMAAYKDAGLTAAGATDILTATVREGNLEAASLAPVLGRVIGLAADMGVGFDQVGASIATYTRLGVSSAEATTALRSTLAAFKKPSDDAHKAADELGLSFSDLRQRIRDDGLQATLDYLIEQTAGNETAMSRLIPSVEAVSMVLGTAGSQGEAYAEVLGNISDATGIVDEGFDAVSQTAEFKFGQAMASLQRVGIELGAVMLPIVTSVLSAVADLASWFGELSKPMKTVVVVVGGMAAAIGPLLIGLGNFLTVLPALKLAMISLNTTMAANPIGAIALAITAVLIPAFIALYRNWDTVVAFLQESWLTFKLSFLLGATGLAEGFESLINGMLWMIRPLASMMGIELPDKVTVFSDAIRRMAADAGTDLGEFRKSQRETTATVEAMATQAEKTATSTGGLSDALDDVSGAADGATGEIVELTEAEKKLKERNAGLIAQINDEFTLSLRSLGDAAGDGRSRAEIEFDQMVEDLGMAIDTSKIKIREMPDAWAQAAYDMAGEVKPAGTWGLLLGSLNNLFRDSSDYIAGLFSGDKGVWDSIVGEDGLSGLIHDVADSGFVDVFSDIVGTVVANITGTAPGTLASAFGSIKNLITGDGSIASNLQSLFLGRDAPLKKFTDAIIDDLGGAIRDLFDGANSPMSGLRDAWDGLKSAIGSSAAGGSGSIWGSLAGLAGAVAPFAAAAAAVYTTWQAISGIIDGIRNGATGTYDPPPGTGGVPLPEVPGTYELPGGPPGTQYPTLPDPPSSSQNLTVVVEIDGEAVGSALVANILRG